MTQTEALKRLIECARLLGQTQAKKGLGIYTQEDSRFEQAMYESIAKHSAAIEQALAQQSNEQVEPVATIRTWHKMGEQHAELWNWNDGLENLPDGSHDVYTHPPVPTAQPDLERIADDLQELCDKQALRIGALEAQLAKPKQEPVNVFVEWLKTRQNDSYSCGVLVRDALEKLEAQPKEPAVPQGHKQEPVWTIDSLEQAIYENTKEFVPLNVMEWLLNRLNTSPPQRKPLTYVDLRRIANQCGLGASEVSAQAQAKVDTFARAIEAAHGIKE